MKGKKNHAHSATGFRFEGDQLLLEGEWTVQNVDRWLSELLKRIRKYPRKFLTLNFAQVQQMDSAGAMAVELVVRMCEDRHINVTFSEISPDIQAVLDNFSAKKLPPKPKIPPKSSLERLGEIIYEVLYVDLLQFLTMVVDLIYFGMVDVFYRRAHRAGEFVRQALYIGVNAVPIIGVVSFLIGVVLALQSSEQLRLFGANLYIADLTAIAMVQEMGPLITAIMVAGRSGSAIASEVATMIVSEEVDALKTMGLSPLRYIVVPKLHAALFVLPFLTILADFFGILGGLVIGYLDLELSPYVFFNRMVQVLYLRDLATGTIKSLVFAYIIVLAGAFYGFRVKGGSEGVGRVTTMAVVAAIFFVIIADSILGLIFY